MIEPVTALVFVGFGASLMLAGIVAGCIVHMRWLDRKLYNPYPKKVQPPKVVI
jgi:hypothetical protein